jgi:transcriptional regulator with XRE-family HTH domain
MTMKRPNSRTEAPASGRVSAIADHVGMRVRLRRRQLGLELAEVARVLNISEDQLQSIERGGGVDVALLYKLAVILEIPTSWFYDGISPSTYMPMEDSSRDPASASREIAEQLTTRDELDLLKVYYEHLNSTDRKRLVQFARVMAVKPE